MMLRFSETCDISVTKVHQIQFDLSQINIFCRQLSKVHIFREGLKFLRNLHRRFVLCSNGQI